MTHRFARAFCRISIVGMAAVLLSCAAFAGDMGRLGGYFTDARGKPVFLLGYYDWASVAGDYYIDQPSTYRDMIDRMSACKLNYVRVSLGISRFSDTTDPKSHDSRPTPVAFRYVNGKADLGEWDETFWAGLRRLCELARSRNMLIHICFFDGVGLRGGRQCYRWNNSPWNARNQIRDFYGDVDVGHDGGADQNGDFYRIENFRKGVGIGHYQRRLIAKAIAETARYDNVFYEIGNELLGSSAEWNSAVISYAKSLTSKPITQNGGGHAANADGTSDHGGDTPQTVRARIARMLGKGCPAWVDPDGSALLNGTPDDLRRAAWYSLTDGAAGWGGFTFDYWNEKFNETKASYYGNLASFVRQSGVRFWEMAPAAGLVSNPGANGCLAKVGSEYLVYVLNDAEVTLDLGAAKGRATVRLYEPKTGAWHKQSVDGGGRRVFRRPDGADDWVIHVRAYRSM